jgi:hypothetical protein
MESGLPGHRLANLNINKISELAVNIYIDAITGISAGHLHDYIAGFFFSPFLCCCIERFPLPSPTP